jgi:predicted amidohydrolase
VKVAAIQHDVVWEDSAATCERVRPLIAQAANAECRIVVLSEMFATGFSMRPEQIAEDEGGPAETFLLAQAAEHDIHLIASVAQRGSDGRYRNNALLAGPAGLLGRYAKIHPFTYSGENEHYAAGESFVTLDVEGLRVSLFVCYDLRFADEFWALGPDTDVFVVPANWPDTRREHWRTLLRARAIENECYVVGVNRVGTVGRLRYVGDSAIIDPLGRALVEAHETESVLVAEVSAERVASVRAEFPFLADRRHSGDR